MPPHLLRCQGIAVGDYSFTLGRLEAGAPSTFVKLGYQSMKGDISSMKKVIIFVLCGFLVGFMSGPSVFAAEKTKKVQKKVNLLKKVLGPRLSKRIIVENLNAVEGAKFTNSINKFYNLLAEEIKYET